MPRSKILTCFECAADLSNLCCLHSSLESDQLHPLSTQKDKKKQKPLLLPTPHVDRKSPSRSGESSVRHFSTTERWGKVIATVATSPTHDNRTIEKQTATLTVLTRRPATFLSTDAFNNEDLHCCTLPFASHYCTVGNDTKALHLEVVRDRLLERQLSLLGGSVVRPVRRRLDRVLGDHQRQLLGGHGVLVEQLLGELLHELLVLRQDGLGAEVGLVHQSLDLDVDAHVHCRSPLLALHAVHPHVHHEGADLLAHAPLRHHLEGDVRHLLEVVGSTGGHLERGTWENGQETNGGEKDGVWSVD